jgi:hypothetical protein
MEWNVLDWNTPAIEFYEKSGAKVFVIGISEWMKWNYYNLLKIN